MDKTNIILSLKESGYSYADIANKLSMSRNTVKSICLRNSKKAEVAEPSNLCLNCGALVINHGSKPKKFCSDKCRSQWHNRLISETEYKLTCKYCGKNFTARGNKRKKYCSNRCLSLAQTP